MAGTIKIILLARWPHSGQPTGKMSGCSQRHALSRCVLPFIGRVRPSPPIAGRSSSPHAKATIDVEPAACIRRAKERSLTQGFPDKPNNDAHIAIYIQILAES